MMQLKWLKKLTFPIFLVLIDLGSTTLIVRGEKLPRPPNTGTPSGNPIPGTTRPEIACPETAKPLTALVANNGSDLTESQWPTLWFYLPYSPAQISNLEFLLLDGNERQTIYRTSIELTQQPGVIKIALPQEPEYALQAEQTYRWRLNLDCEPDTTVEPDLVLDGWIRTAGAPRDSQAPVNLKDYYNQRDREIWYDAINSLAELYFANPADPEVSAAWTELLESLEIDWVIGESLVE